MRITHDGSWSMWKCTKCGKIVHCVRYEEPKECDCFYVHRKVGRLIRIYCKLSPYTYGGTVYQRKQYKKARYRKREKREWHRINKALDRMLKQKDGEQEVQDGVHS